MKPSNKNMDKAKDAIVKLFSRFTKMKNSAKSSNLPGKNKSLSGPPGSAVPERKSPSSKFTNGKMRVEVSKFETSEGASHSRHKREDITLPFNYGDNKIIAMVRDPWWLYTYWEITPDVETAAKQRMAKEGAQLEASILRIYDITGIKDFTGSNANSFFDIRLKNMAQNWYVDVGKPNKSWCIEIGLLSKDGRFYCLARSNFVSTPRFGMSEIMDEEWMSSEEDYWMLFGVSGGFGIGKSSMEIKEIFHKYFKEWVSSGAISSFSSFVLSER